MLAAAAEFPVDDIVGCVAVEGGLTATGDGGLGAPVNHIVSGCVLSVVTGISGSVSQHVVGHTLLLGGGVTSDILSSGLVLSGMVRRLSLHHLAV